FTIFLALKILTTEGREKTISFHTEHQAQTNALSPRSDTQTYQNANARCMYFFSFPLMLM
ncbi:hypothetical protein, partial [Actinobacillus pleuropneumoniae]